MMNKATIADGENMQDIQSLARRAQDLGEKVDWWNTAIIWVLVFAAMVALGTVLATYMAFKRAKQFADAQGQLDAAKEKQLSKDLNAKALEIERVRRDAGIANQRAGEANKAAAEIRQKNLETEKVLEQESDKRLELEKSVTFRRLISHNDSTRGESDSEPLKQFAGVQVILEFLPDLEPSRAASDLSDVLRDAKWNVIKYAANPKLNDKSFDGVTIERPITDGPSPNPVDVRTAAAAGQLMAFLELNEWQGVFVPVNVSKEAVDKPGYIAPNTIRISVGNRPISYELLRSMIERVQKEFIRRQKEDEQVRKSRQPLQP